ncbi:inositol monophosphatase family protein [Seohaeicola saemankumensis]|uniref:Inositol monophosphatase family protein n=1 Tax=Seohaeicola saemankumensis TaxID=481181 RepID=A0ABW3TI68_9RHOB
MPATDLDLLIAAAQAAGQLATSFSGPTAKRWDKDAGAGPVTEADLAVDRLLRERLTGARPDYGWLSEETPDSPDRLDRARVFIVDPIDGTRSFIDGSATWAHSLAVAEDGQITAAVVFLPLKNKLYTAAAGQGACLNGNPIRASAPDGISGASMLAARPVYDPGNWRGNAVPAMERHHRPSLAYRLSLVAEGRFDAMLTLRPSWEWDIAAGALILQEAGARTTDRTGAALRFNNPHPQVNGVLAAGDRLHRALADRLAPWPG